MTPVRRDRLGAITLVALLHFAILYILITGLAPALVRDVEDQLSVFTIPAPVPPPILAAADQARAPQAEGAAAPPDLRAEPTPVTAPPPRLAVPTPNPIRPAEKAPDPEGAAPNAGAAILPGPGTGSGGLGEGTGSGSAGTGPGGGGGGMRAVRIGGAITNADYPAAALRRGATGSVTVAFVVDTEGRATGCRISRSSDHADLDRLTCRLVERRFRYRPARDANGQAVPESVSRTFDWILPIAAPDGRLTSAR